MNKKIKNYIKTLKKNYNKTLSNEGFVVEVLFYRELI